MGDQRDQRIQALVVLELVHVVQNEHERLAARGQRRAETGEAARPERVAGSGERLEHGRLDRPFGVQRLGDVRQQDDGVIVAMVQRDPGERAIVGCRPLAEGSRLAVTGRRDDTDEAAVGRAREALDDARALDEARPWGRNVELRPQQLEHPRLPLMGSDARRRSAVLALRL